MRELDRWATVRGCVVAWGFAASVWASAEMSHDIGRRQAGVAEYAATDEAHRTAKQFLGLLNYHAQRMKHQ